MTFLCSSCQCQSALFSSLDYLPLSNCQLSHFTLWAMTVNVSAIKLLLRARCLARLRNVGESREDWAIVRGEGGGWGAHRGRVLISVPRNRGCKHFLLVTYTKVKSWRWECFLLLCLSVPMEIADKIINSRFQWSWERLLHVARWQTLMLCSWDMKVKKME